MLIPFPDELFTIKGNPAALADLANQYRTKAQALQAHAGDVSAQRDAVWHGLSSDVYRDLLTKLSSGLDRTAEPFAHAAQALESFSEEMAAAQKAMVPLRDEAKQLYAQLVAAEQEVQTEETLKRGGIAMPVHVPGGGVSGFMPTPPVPGMTQMEIDTRMKELVLLAGFGAVVQQAQQLQDHVRGCAQQCANQLRADSAAPVAYTPFAAGSGKEGPVKLDPASIEAQATATAQGQIGDCSVVATLMAWGMSRPEEVRRNMVFHPADEPGNDEGDHWTVTIYASFTDRYTHQPIVDPQDIDVTMSDLPPGGARLPDGTISYISVYEAAYNKSISGTPDDTTNLEDGSTPAEVMPQLTGHAPLEAYGHKVSFEELARSANAGHMTLVGTTNGGNVPLPGRGTLLGNHAYVVVGVDHGGMLILKNPHGNDNPFDSGEIHVSKAEFGRYIVDDTATAGN